MAKEMPQINPPKARATPTQEEIAQRAYEIYVERGRPDGRDMEHWLEAEGQLMAASERFSVREAKTSARRQTSR